MAALAWCGSQCDMPAVLAVLLTVPLFWRWPLLLADVRFIASLRSKEARPDGKLSAPRPVAARTLKRTGHAIAATRAL